ncbi:fibroleukin-like [Glandiceps talaboti]
MAPLKFIVFLVLLYDAVAQDTNRRAGLPLTRSDDNINKYSDAGVKVMNATNELLQTIDDSIKKSKDVNAQALNTTNENLQNLDKTIKEHSFEHLETITESTDATNEKLRSIDGSIQQLIGTMTVTNERIFAMNENIAQLIRSTNAKLDRNEEFTVQFQENFQSLMGILTTYFRPRRDCYDILSLGETANGVYRINPTGDREFSVYCDMNLRGWMVFQRREDNSVNFYRYWNYYKRGFGDPSGEFWMGNDKIHQLTTIRRYELRIDMEAFNGDKAYAKYDSFSIEDETNKYKLHIGSYSGTADC